MQIDKKEKLLLDTHVWIWLLNGDRQNLNAGILSALTAAGGSGLLRVSAISLWEVAMLEAKGRIHIKMDCLDWLNAALSAPGVSLVPLTPEIAVSSAQLPGEFHGDPADRIIVATARIIDALVVTRDRRITSYASQGYVRILA